MRRMCGEHAKKVSSHDEKSAECSRVRVRVRVVQRSTSALLDTR